MSEPEMRIPEYLLNKLRMKSRDWQLCVAVVQPALKIVNDRRAELDDFVEILREDTIARYGEGAELELDKDGNVTGKVIVKPKIAP